MRLMIAAWFMFALTADASTAASEQTTASRHAPNIKTGIPYAQAHKQMLAAGFVPYRVRFYRLVKTPCLGREEICRAYPEAADCAGTGNADCEFLFTKGVGVIVMIHTIGEQLADLTVQDVKTLTRAQVGKLY